MKDIVVVAGLVVSLAVLMTAHIAITYGLVWRTPRWRAAVALFVVPLAPYWAWQEHMRVRAGIWGAALLVYVIATVVARV